MQLTEQAICEFRKIYQKEYGSTISREKAIEYGTRLVDLIKIVYGGRIPKSLDGKKKRAYDKYGHS